MTTDFSSARITTDFQGLAKLKHAANENAPEAIREVGKQFESIMVHMMLKTMRKTEFGDGLLTSQQSRMYRDMYDQQMASHLTQGKGLGLADMIVNQLQGGTAGVTSTTPTGSIIKDLESSRAGPVLAPLRPTPAIKPLPSVQPYTLPERTIKPHSQTKPELASNVIASKPDSPLFATPEAFIQTLWPHAQAAAKKLNVRPEVLLAQSALETGWGKAMPQRADGSNSHNLFGIKANKNWQGDRVNKPTLEFENGLMQRKRASFRSYDSYAESFADYADFIKGNPRYGKALQQASDPTAYVEALQQAGYATDPDYAKKIGSILARQSFKHLIDHANG